MDSLPDVAFDHKAHRPGDEQYRMLAQLKDKNRIWSFTGKSGPSDRDITKKSSFALFATGRCV